MMTQSPVRSHWIFLFSFYSLVVQGGINYEEKKKSLTVLAFIFQQTGNENDTILGATLCYLSSVLQ